MTTSVAPISDRQVGGLDNLPLPSHHQSTPNQQFPRSDSDVSQSSAATTTSVPRSSSFTRSKRFLTGDGLSAREALGIIDQQNGPPVETHSIQLVQNFDIARSAMHQIFGLPNSHSNHSPPPPPKPLTSHHNHNPPVIPSAPTVPPPPPPLLSRLVFGDDAITPTSPQPSHRSHVSEHSPPFSPSPSPQSPQTLSTPTPTHPTSILRPYTSHSPSLTPTPYKPKSRGRSHVTPAPRKTTFANAPQPLQLETNSKPADTMLRPHPTPPTLTTLHRSKTMSRLFGIFSNSTSNPADRNAKGATDPTAKTPSKEQSSSITVNDFQQTNNSRSLPLLRRLAAPQPATLLSESADQGHTTYASDDDSSLSNIADFVVQERPLFSRESRSESTATRSEQGDTYEQGHARNAPEGTLSRVSNAKPMMPSTAFSLTSRSSNPTHTFDSVPVHVGSEKPLAEGQSEMKNDYVRRRMDLFKKFKAIEDYITHDLNVVSNAERDSPTRKVETQQELSTSLQPALDEPVSNEPNPASSMPRRVRIDHRPVPSDDDVSFTSAPEDLADSNEGDENTTRNKSPQQNDPSDFEKSPKSSVESPTVESMTTSSSSRSRGDRFCDHPGPAGMNPDVYHLRGGGMVDFSGALIDESLRPSRQYPLSMLPSNGLSGVNAHGFMDGPVTDAVVEENAKVHRTRRDSHAAFLKTLAESQDSKGRRVTENEMDPQSGMRRTRSGLRQRIAATARLLPRGRSFPRLRTWGDGIKQDWKSTERSKSMSRHSKERDVKVEKAGEKQVKRPIHEVTADVSTAKDEKSGAGEKTRQPKVAYVGEVARACKGTQGGTKECIEKRVKQNEKNMEMEKMINSPVLDGASHSESGTKASRRIDSVVRSAAQAAEKRAAENKTAFAKAEEDSVTLEEQGTKRCMLVSGRTQVGPSNEEAEAADKCKLKLENDRTREPAIVQAVERKGEKNRESKAEVRMSSSGFENSEGATAPMVTIERVIRRVKADGSSETVRRKIRLRPERVLGNGDVVVKRTLQRMKEDGSGTEILTVRQVIPRRRKEGGGCLNVECGNAREDVKMEEQRKCGSRSKSLPGKEGRQGIEGKGSGENEDEKEEKERGVWKRVWSFQGRDGGGMRVRRK